MFSGMLEADFKNLDESFLEKKTISGMSIPQNPHRDHFRFKLQGVCES